MSEFAEILKSELGTKTLKDTGISGGGCISSGNTFDTDHGRVFIKVNTKSGARTMFEGEYASLEAFYNANIVRVPKPIKIIDRPGGGAMFAMEYLDMGRGLSKYAATLGEQLGRLHLQNAEICKTQQKLENRITKGGKEFEGVTKFGFHINTCCGYLEMNNSWKDDWPSFYADKIEMQMKRIDKDYGDRQAREKWHEVLNKFSKYFEGVDIQPALVHGDLWGGNVAENETGPVIFDPASFYGHSEYDLGISYLFGGFNSHFFSAYHKVIPKAPGFQGRKELYKLFHYLNHWNHFGTGYRGSSMSTFEAALHCV